jgi:magnesium transporter
MNTRRHKRIIELVQSVESIVAHNRDTHGRLADLFYDVSDQDVAAVLDIHPEHRLLVFKVINSARKSAILDLVNGHTLRSITSHLSNHELAALIEASPSIICQKIINTIERPRLDSLIPMVVHEERRSNLLNFVNYPERSVGRIMQSELIVVKNNFSVEQALNEVAGFNVFNGPVYQIYVVDEKDNFIGTIPISGLVREARTKKLFNIYIQKPPVITPLTTQRKAAEMFQEYDLIEAPITSKGKLAGRVLVDDILDVLQQEFTSDIQKFAGITENETMQTSAVQSSRRRLPWMVANIFLDLVAVSVIMPFQETIAAVTALAVIMPIVSDMGGNVGIQALSVSIRALASNRPDWKLATKELFKEIRVGILNGVVLGAIIGIVSYVLWQNPFLGLVVMIALFLNTILASVVGGVLPIILKRLKKDPAMMSGAVLTTITDFFGFLLFLSLARAFMEFLV